MKKRPWNICQSCVRRSSMWAARSRRRSRRMIWTRRRNCSTAGFRSWDASLQRRRKRSRARIWAWFTRVWPRTRSRALSPNGPGSRWRSSPRASGARRFTWMICFTGAWSDRTRAWRRWPRRSSVLKRGSRIRRSRSVRSCS